MRYLQLCTLLWLTACARALHFYLDTDEQRCFIEELPTDTIVEGHYRALEWSEKAQAYVENPDLGVLVEVDELETGHNVVRTRGPPDGRFTFTSHEAGDHAVCLSASYAAGGGGGGGGALFGATHVRLYLDVVVGATAPDAEHDRAHVSALSAKLRDLNQKLEDIRREQQYQREREANFRDLSESTNSRAVWYSFAQIAVLVMTCAWQLRHLRRFFEDRKMH